MQYTATVADTRPLDSTTSAGILLSDYFFVAFVMFVRNSNFFQDMQFKLGLRQNGWFKWS